ncbi:MAG: hypothetical protein ACYDBQ_03235 [Thermoplasmatota archaeon]
MRAWPVLLIVIVAPAAGAATIANPTSPTPTTLYFHVTGSADMPINTQRPPDNWTADGGNTGIGTVSSSCVPAVPGEAFTGQEHHTFFGYGSPAFVDYNFVANGHPRIYPERGLSFDAHLDPSQPWVVHWYLATQAAGGVPAPGSGVGANSAPVVIPNVVVKVTVRTGEAISIGTTSYDTGDIVAQGETAPLALAGPLSNQLDAGKRGYEGYNETGDGSNVYGFSVPLAIERSVLPKLGYNVRIDVYVDNPLCNDPGGSGYVMPNNVRVYSSAAHRPRMTLAVTDPLRIDYLTPAFVAHGIAVIHAAAESPWGNYDVWPAFALNSTVPPVGFQLYEVVYTSCHCYGPPQDVASTWLWNFTGHRGTYDVSATVSNLQFTATAFATASFDVGSGRIDSCSDAQGKTTCSHTVNALGVVQAAPGAGWGWAALVVAAAVLARRQ